MSAASVHGMRQVIPLTSSVSHWSALAARLFLGGLFLYAGFSKIIAPYHFAAAIQAYQLLPPALVAVTAVFLPWIEVVAATALMVGFKPRSALLVLSGLMAIFLVAIAVTMARGLDIDCGCGLLAERPVGWQALLEDGLVLICLLALLAFHARRRRPEETALPAGTAGRALQAESKKLQ